MRCEKCYLFVEEAKTWTDARYYCQQHGADLVTVKDEATNFFLSRYIRNKSFSVRNVYIGKIYNQIYFMAWGFSSFNLHFLLKIK